MNRWHKRLADLRTPRPGGLGTPVQNVQNVQNGSPADAFEHYEHIEQPAGVSTSSTPAVPDRLRKNEINEKSPTPVAWGEAEEERAALVQYDAGVLRPWAEALARLDPGRPPRDVPLRRWVQFINDCGHFLDHGWAAKAERLGWRAVDLFGCDRERPFARIDAAGLLWLVNGQKLVALSVDRAVIEISVTGTLQIYYRKSAMPGSIVLPRQR
jgi:hypothetical protein